MAGEWMRTPFIGPQMGLSAKGTLSEPVMIIQQTSFLNGNPNTGI